MLGLGVLLLLSQSIPYSKGKLQDSIVSGDYVFQTFTEKGLYPDAKAFCVGRGGWPAEPRTEQLNNNLVNILNSSGSTYGGYFIGLVHDRGEWKWQRDGSAAMYTNWSSDEGTGAALFHCNIYAIITDTGAWEDRWGTSESDGCGALPRRFACQYNNYCAKQPCKNGGSCTPTPTISPYYSCDCNRTGFKGDTCDDTILHHDFLYAAKKDKLVWYPDANNSCSDMEGWLAEPKDENINNVLTTIILQSNNLYFIGLRYYDGQWKWMDGSIATYTNWNTETEADDPVSSKVSVMCAAIDGNGKWWSVYCELFRENMGAQRRYICQIRNNYCASDPCKNGGSCTPTTGNPPYYSCDCSGTGYKGNTCEDNYCIMSNSCKNNGRCMATPKTFPYYRCDCTTIGYKGDTCENDYCTTSQCKNSGVCAPTPNTSPYYRCDCTSGYIGKNCEKNFCTKNPCSNAGKCIPTPSIPPHYICNCTGTGYKGDTCLDDYCVSNPCDNGGNCTSTPNNLPYYLCSCSSGYYGMNCESNMLPIIEGITTAPCTNDGVITLNWRPENKTRPVKHRFTLLLGTAKVFPPQMISYPQNKTLIFSSLAPNKNYKVLIEVCPNDCIINLNASAHVKTGDGTAGKARSLKVERRNKTCSVQWSAPKETNGYITQYLVEWRSTSVYQPRTTRHRTVLITDTVNSSEYRSVIATEPNRKYIAIVYVKTCAGLGPKEHADTSCITPFEPPYELKPLEIEYTQETKYTREIKISAVDETNGPISCVFIIVQKGDEWKDKVFQANDLIWLQYNAEKDGVDGYLALAIARENIPPEGLEANLGDGTTTTCNTMKSGQSRVKRLTGQSFQARNIALDNEGKTYSMITLTTTPLESGFVMQQSKIQTFRQGETPLSTMLWVIGPVLGGILIMATMGVIYYKRKKLQKNVSEKIDPEPPVAPSQDMIGLSRINRDDSLYQSISNSVYENCTPRGENYENDEFRNRL